MKILLFTLLAVMAMEADAQGFQDEPTCYSWNGGHKSAGSFSKCNPELQALTKKPAPPVVAPAPAVVTPVSPPVVLCQTFIPEVPANKPVFIKKRPLRPKQVCK